LKNTAKQVPSNIKIFHYIIFIDGNTLIMFNFSKFWLQKLKRSIKKGERGS